jgi:Ca2+-binding RTX toxin-like protein
VDTGEVCNLPGGCDQDEGADAYDGGPGTDVLDYGAFTRSGVSVDLAGGTATGAGSDTLAAIEDVTGTQLSDVLRGDDGPNLLSAGAGGGDDRLEGRGGDDVLHDTFNEPVPQGEEDDVFDGGPGDDAITGALGDDRIVGGEGADRLFGGPGVDRVEGGPGDDTLHASGEGDELDGGDGIDTVDYSQARGGVTVDLAAGSGEVGGGAADMLRLLENAVGTPAADELRGSDEANALEGLAGDDVLDGREGTDTLDGGPGSDSCANGETVTRCEA